jgi:hypothetical protein
VTAGLESARRDWADGYRALRAERDTAERERLHEQVDAVTAELRKRVGSTFTLAQLADAYAGSERWVAAAIAEVAGGPGWVRTAAVAGDAAFHLYARGAQDYVP